MSSLSASLENYLETILSISEEKDNVKASEISRKLSVSKSSVTEALRTLRDKGFVNYAPYEDITLTNEGLNTARDIAQKHEVLYGFLHNILGVEENEALETACQIEHVISKNVLNKFIAFNEFNEQNCSQNKSCVQQFHSFLSK